MRTNDALDASTGVVTFTRSGVPLGPAAGELLAAEAVDGQLSPLLGPLPRRSRRAA